MRYLAVIRCIRCDCSSCDAVVTALHKFCPMTDTDLLERETTHCIVGAFYEVFNTLGYGFLENVYRDALEPGTR